MFLKYATFDVQLTSSMNLIRFNACPSDVSSNANKLAESSLHMRLVALLKKDLSCNFMVNYWVIFLNIKIINH